MDDSDIFKALTARRLVDLVSFLILILIGIILMKISKLVGLTLIVWSSIVFIWIQTIPYALPMGEELVVENKSLTNIDITNQNLSLIPFFASGIIHIASAVSRTRKYDLTKMIARGHIMRCSQKVIIRGFDKTPSRQIILSQHVPGIADVFSFLIFTGNNSISVIQDLGSSKLAKLTSLFLSPIYGGINIDRTNKELTKYKIQEVADSMKISSDVSYVLWPSGSMWKDNMKNGIVDFRNGAFYLSMYSQIPLCFVHVRGNSKIMIIEKSKYISPPPLGNIPPNITYDDFIERPGVKDLVVGFRDEVEKIYREMDDKLYAEINL